MFILYQSFNCINEKYQFVYISRIRKTGLFIWAQCVLWVRSSFSNSVQAPSLGLLLLNSSRRIHSLQQLVSLDPPIGLEISLWVYFFLLSRYVVANLCCFTYNYCKQLFPGYYKFFLYMKATFRKYKRVSSFNFIIFYLCFILVYSYF